MNNGIRDLPSSWALVKLGEFVENEKGKKPKNESPEKTENHSIPYVDIQAFEENIIRTWTDGVGCRKCYETDFLMVWDGSRSGLVGNGMNGALGSTLVRINFPSMINKYAYYFLQSKYQQINTRAKGSGTPHVDPDLVWNYNFPIPPLNEQHRIVAKIEELFSELDQGIDNLKTAQAQLKVYRQALLKHAFEGKLTAEWRAQNADKLKSASALQQRIQHAREQRYQQQLAEWQANGKQGSKPKAPKPITPLTVEELAELPALPEGWAWTRLGNTNVEVTDGPFGSNLKSSDYVDSGVRVVRLENIGALKFIEEKESFVTEEKYELLKRHTVTSGDIVFSSFIIENVRVALVPPSITKAINKADCFCVRFSGETLSNVYAVLFLSTRHVYKQLESLIHGVGRPRINTTQLKDVVIPVCGDAEQQVIIAELEARLSEVDQLDQTITSCLQQAEALRLSILKKAFSGELVAQDPNDEPAAALLARIQAEKGKSDRRRQ